MEKAHPEITVPIVQKPAVRKIKKPKIVLERFSEEGQSVEPLAEPEPLAKPEPVTEPLAQTVSLSVEPEPVIRKLTIKKPTLKPL